MKLAFRVDASQRIGSGHLMRCLTLATTAAAEGHPCVFFSRRLPSGLQTLLADRGMDVETVPGEPPAGAPEQPLPDWQAEARWLLDHFGSIPFDWLVCDHYGLDRGWEAAVGPLARRRMVIDDLANRRHECDLLLDQTYGRSDRAYQGLVPARARLLLGPRFALLRREFGEWRQAALERRADLPPSVHLLVNLGGGDAVGTTATLLRLLAGRLPNRIGRLTVVVGQAPDGDSELDEAASQVGVSCSVLHGVANMAELMAGADLAVGAAGSTSWERCCLGLPAVMVSLADNQRLIAEGLDQGGAAVHAGTLTEIESDPQRLLEPLCGLADDPGCYRAMSKAAADIVDGQGALRAWEQLRACTAEPAASGFSLSGAGP